MISTEVKRTLVKSPPELWAELSDAAALARHLGELGDIGEIRVTRADPEKRVDWEADGAKGTVLIKPSGWGTKVSLSVKRELPPAAEAPAAAEETSAEEELPALEPPPSAEEQAILEPAAAAEEPVSEPVAPAEHTEALLAPELAPEPEPEPIVQAAPEEPRRGFFARLFGRRRAAAPQDSERESPASEPSELSSPELGGSELPAGEPQSTSSAIEALQARFQPETRPAAETKPTEQITQAEPNDAAPSPSQPADPPAPVASSEDALAPTAEAAGAESAAVDISAELQASEEEIAAEVTAVLTGVLDRLGAAHHRPFSRA